MAMAIGYLYSYQASVALTQTNARAVLAAACLLGGVNDLCERAYHVCKDSIRVDSIEDWLKWVDDHSSPFRSHSPSSSAVSTPRSPSPQSAQEVPVASIYGPYAQMLRDDVLEFLTVSLPSILLADSETSKTEMSGDATEALLRVFSRVPFDSQSTPTQTPHPNE